MKITKKTVDSSQMSLSKYLAQAGYCSRRQAIAVIAEQKVTVNGAHITDPAFKINVGDVVKVGRKSITMEEKIYILLNKPKGYVTTASDEKGRKTVMDLVVDAPKVRLYPVGRLDMDTTGLLLLTNDGELAQKLSHPKYEVSKTYIVTLDKPLTETDRLAIEKGVRLVDGKVKVDSINYVHPRTPTKIRVVLHSGKNRVVRRIFTHFGYYVLNLDRVGFAHLTKKGLPGGRWRFLSKQDELRLKK